MRVFGWILFALGVVVIVWGLSIDTTVANDGGAALGAEFPRIQNLGLLQDRELTVQIGLALLISGSIFATVPRIREIGQFSAELSEPVTAKYGVAPPGETDSADSDDEELKNLGVKLHGTLYFFHGTGFRTASEAAEYARANQWMRQ